MEGTVPRVKKLCKNYFRLLYTTYVDGSLETVYKSISSRTHTRRISWTELKKTPNITVCNVGTKWQVCDTWTALYSGGRAVTQPVHTCYKFCTHIHGWLRSRTETQICVPKQFPFYERNILDFFISIILSIIVLLKFLSPKTGSISFFPYFKT